MKSFFDPSSIALIGVSEKEGTVGNDIFLNLLNSREIRIYPVNPKYEKIGELKCYKKIGEISDPVDLALIAIPAKGVPGIIQECADAKVSSAIIYSAGFKESGEEGRLLEEEIRNIQKKYPIRIIGPNCLGLIRPHSELNASFLRTKLEKGKIAFISQSGALGSAILSWASDSHIGFSTFVSLGSMADVDFGDIIDFLGDDPHTRSIMIYMESVGDAKKFLSAARGFSRSKPIIVLKPGRYSESVQAVTSHTGSLAGGDDVYEAAFRRAGVIRVKEISDLFHVAEALHSKNLPAGPNLAVITNAGGPGVMATDMIKDKEGNLAILSSKTIEALNEKLPAFWSHANPIDILGDADTSRYKDAIEVCLKETSINGILVIYSPQGGVKPDELAEEICKISKKTSLPILTVWMGGNTILNARDFCLKNGIPSFATPEDAVKTYFYMFHYNRNLELLYQTPGELSLDEAPPRHHLRAMIHRILKENRTLLTEVEAKSFLQVYGISYPKMEVFTDPKSAVLWCKENGYPVVLKISSPDIFHKTDIEGVIIGIRNDEELLRSWKHLEETTKTHLKEKAPSFLIEKMIEKIDYELILGSKKDKDFGSVILFGQGGTFAEYYKDYAVGLPPLNQILARRLIESTKVRNLISGFRNFPSVDMGALEKIIAGFANMIVDFPEIQEAEINPLAVSSSRAYALDAKIIIHKYESESKSEFPHLVISPYPTRYVLDWKMNDSTEVLIRPIRPEDEPLEFKMLTTLSEEALRYRFFQVIKNISHEMLIRFCNIDYDREMAFVGETKENGERKIIGIGRLIMDHDFSGGEFAVVVHDKFQRRGLGYKIVDMLIGVAQERKIGKVFGYVLSDNIGMLRICENYGFTIKPLPENTTYVELILS